MTYNSLSDEYIDLVLGVSQSSIRCDGIKVALRRHGLVGGSHMESEVVGVGIECVLGFKIRRKHHYQFLVAEGLCDHVQAMFHLQTRATVSAMTKAAAAAAATTILATKHSYFDRC